MLVRRRVVVVVVGAIFYQNSHLHQLLHGRLGGAGCSIFSPYKRRKHKKLFIKKRYFPNFLCSNHSTTITELLFGNFFPPLLSFIPCLAN